MKNPENILNKLSPTYFWDVDYSNLDPIKSKRLIIERIINLGTVDEIFVIIKYYGEEEVKEEILSLNYLDPKTLNFFAFYFNIQKTSFKCYTRKRLNQQHWNS